MSLRYLKISITVSTALLFSLIAFNNITDYSTNFGLVKTVMSMETVKSTSVKWRALTSPLIHHAVYIGIITWECLIALFCWIGLFKKRFASLGLTLGFVLFMGGFVIVAGEWFYLWNSDLGSIYPKAVLIALTLGAFNYFVEPSSVA